MRAIQRFGKQLQRVRSSQGLTQEELAVKAGLSRVSLAKLELGQHDPLLSTLGRLAKALRVSVTDLLGESVSPSEWWQVAGRRFSTREEAEEYALATSELFIARHRQDRAGALTRRLFALRSSPRLKPSGEPAESDQRA